MKKPKGKLICRGCGMFYPDLDKYKRSCPNCGTENKAEQK